MSILNKTWSESDVLCHFLGERTVRDGADWLNKQLPEKYQVSHTTVHNWMQNKNEMESRFFYALQIFYPEDDPRHELGHELEQRRLDAMKRQIRQVRAEGVS